MNAILGISLIVVACAFVVGLPLHIFLTLVSKKYRK